MEPTQNAEQPYEPEPDPRVVAMQRLVDAEGAHQSARDSLRRAQSRAEDTAAALAEAQTALTEILR